MQLELTEEQDGLREGVRALLSRELPDTPGVAWDRPEEVGAEPPPAAVGVWDRMVEQGWPSLPVPESHGGAGLGAFETALAAQQLGRRPFPSPFLSTVLVAQLLTRFGTPEQQDEHLPALAGGEATAAVAIAAGGDPDPANSGIDAHRDGAEWSLSGTAFPVADGWGASLLVAFAVDDGAGRDGLTAFLVPVEAGVEVQGVTALDLTRSAAALRFREVRCSDVQVLGDVGAGWEVALTAVAHGSALLAAEMAGGARALLDLSIDYSLTREQFGRQIGSFQAVAHPLADVHLWVEHAESATYHAAWSLDHDLEEAPLATSIAKLTAARAYRMAAERAIQTHGGIGFTWERGLHLHYRRALANERHFGSSDWHAERIARHSGRWA